MNKYTKDLIKQISLTAVLGGFLYSASAQAGTIAEHYSVTQDHITVKVSAKSGLPKASCKFLDKEGNRVAGQNVTVVEQFDNTTIIEANLYFEQHSKVSTIKCL